MFSRKPVLVVREKIGGMIIIAHIFLSNKYVLVCTAIPLLDPCGEGTLQLVGIARI